MFLHSISTQLATVSSDQTKSYDLPVNPLSVILLKVQVLNDTTAGVSGFPSYMEVAKALERIAIYAKGDAVLNIRGEDLVALNYFRHGIVPTEAMTSNVDNYVRPFVIPILLGRNAYDAKSLLPAHRRGELVLEVTFDVASTGYDNLSFGTESIEILGATPSEYERKTQISQTLAATGDNDIDLAPGKKLRGCLLFGAAGFTGTSPAPTLGRISFLMDNQQVGYTATDFEVLHMLHTLWGRQPPFAGEHQHVVNADGGTTTESVGKPFNIGSGDFQKYAFLDFDPTRDDEFTLDTSSAVRVVVHSDAEATGLVRVIPIEVMP